MVARCCTAGPWIAVRGGGAGEIVRYAIIVASFLAANAGATEIDSPRHPFLLRRTDHTRLYPKAWVTTTARDQAVLDRVSSEGQFPAYHRYLATRSYRHNRLKLHNRSAGLTSISTDPPRVTKFRAQLSRREARRSGPAIRQTQALKQQCLPNLPQIARTGRHLRWVYSALRKQPQRPLYQNQIMMRVGARLLSARLPHWRNRHPRPLSPNDNRRRKRRNRHNRHPRWKWPRRSLGRRPKRPSPK